MHVQNIYSSECIQFLVIPYYFKSRYSLEKSDAKNAQKILFSVYLVLYLASAQIVTTESMTIDDPPNVLYKRELRYKFSSIPVVSFLEIET